MPARAKTDDSCTAEKHGSFRAWEVGCICQAAIDGRQRRRETQAASAKVRAVKQRPSLAEEIDSEPDFVLVAQVAAGEKRWRDLEREVDRIALVVEMARTLTVSQISTRIGAGRDRIAALLGQREQVSA